MLGDCSPQRLIERSGGRERPEEGGAFYDVNGSGRHVLGTQTGGCPPQGVNAPRGSGARAGTTPGQPVRHGSRRQPGWCGERGTSGYPAGRQGPGQARTGDGAALVCQPPLPPAPGSGQAEALASALCSNRQASGATPSHTRRQGGGACGSRPEKPIQGGQAGLGNDPGPNGSLFIIGLRPKTTTDSPPPPQAPGGGGLGAKKETGRRLRGPTLTCFPPLEKEGQRLLWRPLKWLRRQRRWMRRGSRSTIPPPHDCWRRRRKEAFGCLLKWWRWRAHPSPGVPAHPLRVALLQPDELQGV